MIFNDKYFQQIKQNNNKSKEKFLKEKNEYLGENISLIRQENYDNLEYLEKYIDLYPQDSQRFFKLTEHKYDYFYRLYRHLQQNYLAKKFKIKLIDPNSKIKNLNNSKEKYFIFRPWGNDPNSQYYNHSVLLEKCNSHIKLYDTLLYPVIITNDKGKKKAKRDENKKLVENVKLRQYVLDTVKKILSTKVNNNIIDGNIMVEECEFLQGNKTNRKLTKPQKSSAGCFEMCLYSYFVFKDRDNRISKLNITNNLKSKEILIDKTDEKLWTFAKKIKLLVKGKGVKDRDVFNIGLEEIEKINNNTLSYLI